MKKSELKQLIREEIKSLLKEYVIWKIDYTYETPRGKVKQKTKDRWETNITNLAKAKAEYLKVLNNPHQATPMGIKPNSYKIISMKKIPDPLYNAIHGTSKTSKKTKPEILSSISKFKFIYDSLETKRTIYNDKFPYHTAYTADVTINGEPIFIIATLFVHEELNKEIYTINIQSEGLIGNFKFKLSGFKNSSSEPFTELKVGNDFNKALKIFGKTIGVSSVKYSKR